MLLSRTLTLALNLFFLGWTRVEDQQSLPHPRL